jgi:hypothetical protein
MIQLPIEEIRSKYLYDPETGRIYLRDSGKASFDLKPAFIEKDYRGYLRLRIMRKHVSAHRLAWALHHGNWPEGPIDHIDRNRSNIRIENLRLATVTENSANRSLQGAVPAKGVHWHKKQQTYMAQIKVAGVTRYLGRFSNLDEAAHAYNKAAIEVQGEFALLNPIGQDKGQP